MRSLAIALLLCSVTAHADPWYHSKKRLVHASVVVVAGTAYVVSETFLKPTFAPTSCSWCNPPGIDRDVRDALKWNNTTVPNTLSSITGFGLAPAVALGFTITGVMTSDNATASRLFDDTVPILEAVTVSQVVNQIVKFSTARARPFVHFGPPMPHDIDDNLSFFSGHSNLTFALATSAGIVAHERHSWTEPYVWTFGMTLAATTAYLRVAADRHYFTDVLTGSAVGVLAGIAATRIYGTFDVMPTGNGVAIAGSF